jgi:hypothetical protein
VALCLNIAFNKPSFTVAAYVNSFYVFYAFVQEYTSRKKYYNKPEFAYKQYNKSDNRVLILSTTSSNLSGFSYHKNKSIAIGLV